MKSIDKPKVAAGFFVFSGRLPLFMYVAISVSVDSAVLNN